jgi:hypothetical protein
MSNRITATDIDNMVTAVNDLLEKNEVSIRVRTYRAYGGTGLHTFNPADDNGGSVGTMLPCGPAREAMRHLEGMRAALILSYLKA